MNSKENRLDEGKLITPLHEILSEEGKKKIVDILKFWDDLKGKWAEARKKFWSKYDRDQFLLQLRHAEKKREELINTNQQKLEEIWFFTRWKKKQEKFTAEYLKALSHYGEMMEEGEDEQEEERITWGEVQKTGFREWVRLDLRGNNIWVDWAEGIAKNLKLKEWMSLDLSANDIWAKWAEAISKMELKEWVRLDLRWNNIWDKSRSTLENWVADAKARGINCEIYL